MTEVHQTQHSVQLALDRLNPYFHLPTPRRAMPRGGWAGCRHMQSRTWGVDDEPLYSCKKNLLFGAGAAWVRSSTKKPTVQYVEGTSIMTVDPHGKS